MAAQALDSELTDAQRVLVEGDGDSFVQACPGSGKTRAIVSRHLRRTAEEPRKGIALVSFTKVAIEEVKRRCGSQLSSLEVPNFVGTFDSFINRFLSGPLYAHAHRKPLDFIESWDSLPSAWLSSGQFEVSLEWFDFDESGNASFRPERVKTLYASSLIKHVEASNGYFCRRATGMWNALIFKNGLASSSASRWLTTTELSKPVTRRLMANLLASRFAEIIVDEAQDCGKDELAVLTFLRAAGVEVTLVGDRDQAIFEFRRATPDELETFAAGLKPGQSLDGNFRSSPAICHLNYSLRVGSAMDKPIGSNADIETPIQVVRYQQFDDLPNQIRAVATKLTIVESDLIVLAHSRSHARQASGSVVVSDIGTQWTMRVADAARIMRVKQAEARSRQRAVDCVERMLLGRIEQSVIPVTDTVDAICRSIGIERRWLRDAAFRTMMAADPTTSDRAQYTARLQAVVESLPFSPLLNLRPVKQYLKTPTEAQWGKLDIVPQDACLRWGTIHSVKGQEFPVVALVIPKKLPTDHNGKTAIDHWDAETAAEARRVLYVGASRAQKLLILAIPTMGWPRVKRILERDHVPFEIAPVG